MEFDACHVQIVPFFHFRRTTNRKQGCTGLTSLWPFLPWTPLYPWASIPRLAGLQLSPYSSSDYMKTLQFLSLTWSCGRRSSARFQRRQPPYNRKMCPQPLHSCRPSDRVSLEEPTTPEFFNLLTSTAHDIQQLFDRSELTAESLVKQVLDQVDKHNRKGLDLGALILSLPDRSS
jgi:hypothetical protein